MIDGKVSLVTGGGSGIGRAVSRLFAKNGSHVLVCSRTERRILETVEMIKAEGGSAAGIVCDVSDERQILKMFTDIEKEHGKLDIFVGAAGSFLSGIIEETSLEDFRTVMDTNLTGLFYVAGKRSGCSEREREAP